MFVSPKAKFWIALVLGLLLDVLTAAQLALGDGVFSVDDGFTVALIVVGSLAVALGVYRTPNTPVPTETDVEITD